MSNFGKHVFFNFRQRLHRRSVLRGAGVAMGLPWLSAMQHAFAGNELAANGNESSSPRRLVAVTIGLGLVSDNLYPSQTGVDYTPSRYLKSLEDLKDRMTLVSGASHPGVNGGHRAEASILTATPIGSAGNAKNGISLDQYLAKHRGIETRFPSLVLSTGGNNSPSYTENGAMVPALDSPAQLFTKLFVDDSLAKREAQAARVRQGRSIMDLVAEDAKSLGRELGGDDRDRLDLYFTSVRELEKRMAEAERWSKLPKPKVDAKKPLDVGNPSDIVARIGMMCDVLRLSLETDSSRFITLHIPGAGGVIPIDGVEEGYHTLSHHGQDEEKLEQLALVEGAILSRWGQFLRELGQVDDGDGKLLDHTSVLLTSNLGNASNHDNRNMPVILAGGRYRHAGHLAFDRRNNAPLPNLYVSILQQLGLEVDQFASSTGTLSGLEIAT